MRTRTVLIADDEPAISFFMGLVLQSLGFSIVLAYDGQQALDLAEAERPDLMFIDTMLPKLDGRDVVRGLRNNPAFKNTPIVLFSAALESDIKWRAAGADAFLSKPFNTLRLRTMVEDLMGKFTEVKEPEAQSEEPRKEQGKLNVESDDERQKAS